MPKSAGSRQLVERLQQLKTAFDGKQSRQKLKLLEQTSVAEFRDAKSLLDYHDTLCFLRAYPDSPKLLKVAESELRRFSDRLDLYREKGGDPVGVRLINSGISDTGVHHTFTYEMAQKLSRWYPTLIEINWEKIGSAPLEAIAGVLPLLVTWQENDLLDNAEAFDVRRFLEAGKTKSQPSTLLVLLQLLRSSALPDKVQHLLYESIELPLVWNLGDTPASRTLNRVEPERVYYQKTELRKRSRNLLGQLRKPGLDLQRLSRQNGEQLVRKVSEVLAVRYRELFPLTNPGPEEVYLAEPGRGLQIYIYGTTPPARLPLEANFGAMFLRNGLPVGYGVGVVLFDRVEIAVNVFPAFRTGESAFLIEQFFRVFYQHFGSRVFLVRKGQMGHGDDEPLKSGAFWFYHKLGFRAFDPRIRELAERESKKLKQKKGYRCSLATLKQLAKSDVVFCCDGTSAAEYKELSLIGLSRAVSKLAIDRFKGDRRALEQSAVRQICRALGIAKLNSWSGSERESLTRFAPVLTCIPQLDLWPQRDKALLAKLIRAKGAAQEKSFVDLANRHRSFQRAVAELANLHAKPQEGGRPRTRPPQ